jgi:hypothetical protein
MLPLIVLLVIAVPIIWLVSEFHGGRGLRIGLGILSIGVVTVVTSGVNDVLTRFNYNAWYGSATGELISSSIKQIEDGRTDRVLKVWRGLGQQFHPTYENRAKYSELVEEAVTRIRGDVPIESDSPWDASEFTSEAWVGHWEDGNGYWIVVDAFGQRGDVVQSGQPRAKVHSVSLSPDFKTLKFKEGDLWLHTLTLKNKYEASYEWFDLQKGSIWQTRPIYKLVKPSEAPQRITESEVPGTKIEPTDSNATK